LQTAQSQETAEKGRTVRIVSYGERGRERAGIVVDNAIVDLAALDASLPSATRALLGCGGIQRLLDIPRSTLEEKAGEPRAIPLEGTRLGPPVPDASKVICLGLNYADHAREQHKDPPERPLLFAKAPSALSGPNDDIVIPPQDDRVDCEAELAVVIGDVARNVSRDEAMKVVAGYMAFNDVSARTIQRGDRQWFRGKSFDTFAPCGPWLVTADEIPTPHSLAISSYVNEMRLQHSNTSELIFDIPYIISYISEAMTLLPGDIISTGTPAGVGVFRDPPVFMKPGDEVVVEIEGIGRLLNKVTGSS